MSYFADNYAHGKKFDFDSTGLPFANLKDVVVENPGKILQVAGVFTYEAKYGVRPVVVTKSLKVNLPDHCLADVQKILSDPEAIRLINEGKVGFQPTTYKDSKGETRYSGKFIDI